MKRIAALFLLILVSITWAETPLEKELALLNKQRDEQIAAAVVPINQRRRR